MRKKFGVAMLLAASLLAAGMIEARAQSQSGASQVAGNAAVITQFWQAIQTAASELAGVEAQQAKDVSSISALQSGSAAQASQISSVQAKQTADEASISSLSIAESSQAQTIAAIQQAEGANGTTVSAFVQGTRAGGWSVGQPGQVHLIGFILPATVTFQHFSVATFAFDGTAGDLYDAGIYNASGALVADVGARPIGALMGAVLSAPVTLAPGKYYLAFTGNAVTGQIFGMDSVHFTFANNVIAAQTSAGGQLPAGITPPPDNWTATGAGGYFAIY